MSPRRTLAVTLVAAALVAGASPALAMTPKAGTSGWSRSDPPADPTALVAELAKTTYAISCGSVTATGWSADVYDDTAAGILSILITTSAVSGACAANPAALRVRQGEVTLEARPWSSHTASGVGTLVSGVDLPYIDWDFVPSPRVGQWVGIAARGVDGEALPMLEGLIVTVGTDSFTVNTAVGEEYVGAPVVDNRGRALGVMTAAGTIVTGTPLFCGEPFDCTDPTRVWWDINAPSAPRNVTASAGKGRVTVTWKPVASDGGDPVNYFSSVNGGPWTEASRFSVTVKARKGVSVTVSVQAVNAAGWGPAVTRTARAR